MEKLDSILTKLLSNGGGTVRCEKCGSEVKGVKFCGKCGTPVQQKTQGPVGQRIKTSFLDNVREDAVLAKAFIAAAVLQVLMLILRFVPFGNYDVSIEGFGVSDRATYSVNEFMEVLGGTFVFVILMVVSILVCALPLIQNMLARRRRMILPIIATVWNGITVGLGIWSLADTVAINTERASYYGMEEAFSWSLTLGGWLNVIVTLASVVVLILIEKIMSEYDWRRIRAERSGTAQPEPAQPGGAGSWQCTCGKVNSAYVSSCACGVNKRDIS